MKPNLRLKRERERRGWTQARVAEVLGTDLQTVSRWERGVHAPYPLFVEKLCTLFGKEAEELGLVQEHEEMFSAQPTSYGPGAATVPIPHRLHSGALPSAHGLLFDPAVPLPNSEFKELIGRKELLLHLKRRLLNEDVLQLTLLRGLPGVGKTTLAMALAHDPEIQAHFQDGILWAGLGPTPNLLGHLSHWGTLLGLAPQNERVSTLNEWAQLIHMTVRDRRILFLLDDAWDIATVMALVLGGPQCAHLVTTRVPQVTYHFTPEATWNIPELDEQESMKLLERFIPTLVSTDPGALQTLIQAVGGLPLALTLIGRYLRAQAATGHPRRLYTALQAMADSTARLRLSEPCSLIDQRAQLSSSATISLETVIAVSEQRINQQQRQALGALAVFPAKPNSFSEEAALVVCQQPVTVLDVLHDVGFVETPEPRRYYLHQVVADYARLHLTPGIEVIQRFVAFMVYFVEDHCLDYNTLAQESANIICALEQAEASGMDTLYVQGVLAFRSFLEVRRWYDLALQLLTRARELASDLQDMTSMFKVLFCLGKISMDQHQLVQAESYLQEGLRLARQQHNRQMVNHFLMALAEALELRGSYSQAYAYLREGLRQAHHLKYHERAQYHRATGHYAQDMMRVHFSELQTIQQHGYLAPIDEYFHTWPDAKTIPSPVLNVITGQDGHIYGIPVDVYVFCLLYNRKLFREAGLDPDRPPTTWEEFRVVARAVSNPAREVYGFAMETIYNQGGWHFTNWLYTAGGQAEQYHNGAWYATFNAPQGVQFLEMLQAMRFQDQSIPKKVFLSSEDILDLFCKEKVAMVVMPPEAIVERYQEGEIDRRDIGLAAMPQNGGNACLMGGTAYVFQAKSSKQTRRAAFEQVVRAYFNPSCADVEEEEGRIGVHSVSFITGSVQPRQAESVAQQINIPLENCRSYIMSNLQFLPEPPIEPQKYYALIDPIIQSVLTDPDVHPQTLLDAAAQEFQHHFLSQPSSQSIKQE